MGDSLLIHGGFCMDSADIATKDLSGDLLAACYLNDVRVLDVVRMQWSRLRTHGTPPKGRFGHSLVLSEDDAILVGGWSGTAKTSPGVAFSLREKVSTGSGKQQGGGREEDETCDYCMTLRTSDMHWVRNKYVGVPAPSRYGHTATAIGPHLIIIGGWDGGKPLNDVVVLRDRSIADRALSGSPPAAPSPGEQEEEYDDDDEMLETGEY